MSYCRQHAMAAGKTEIRFTHARSETMRSSLKKIIRHLPRKSSAIRRFAPSKLTLRQQDIFIGTVAALASTLMARVAAHDDPLGAHHKHTTDGTPTTPLEMLTQSTMQSHSSSGRHLQTLVTCVTALPLLLHGDGT